MKYWKLNCFIVLFLMSVNAFASREYREINVTPDMLASFPQTQEWSLNNNIRNLNIANHSGTPIKVTIKVSPATMGSTPLYIRCADNHVDNKYVPTPGDTITCQIDDGFVELGAGYEGLQYTGMYTLEKATS